MLQVFLTDTQRYRNETRLDLTVEAIILIPEWHDLFSEEERNIARERLTQYGYNVNQTP